MRISIVRCGKKMRSEWYYCVTESRRDSRIRLGGSGSGNEEIECYGGAVERYAMIGEIYW